MNHPLQRREFLATSAATIGSLAIAGSLQAKNTPSFKTTLKPAVIGNPTEDNIKKWKEVGFQGIEVNGDEDIICKPADEAAKDRQVAARHGMEIHSVIFGWGKLNSKDPSEIEACKDKIRRSIDAAKGYGASTVLLVPCHVRNIAMPEPWEFDIKFDEKTSMVKSVVPGDNSKYAEYIEAQNWATESSRKAIRELIPYAEKRGVVIAIENVWNNLWISPALIANFIASFNSPQVQGYVDIGNHVKYAKPTEYLYAEGKLVNRIHFKDFKLNPDGHGGKFIDIREGSVDWPAVRKAIDEIGYNGFVTIESSKLPEPEQVKRMNLIISGK